MVNGRLQFQNYPTYQCTKMLRREHLCFLDKKLSKSSEFYYLEPGPYPFIMDIVEALIILIQERHNHSENCIKVKVSQRMKKLTFTLQMEDPVLYSLVQISDTFSEVMLVRSLE